VLETETRKSYIKRTCRPPGCGLPGEGRH
jgi:hypothetical protein